MYAGLQEFSTENYLRYVNKEESIVKCVRELKSKFKYIFTTGGIGPTHDDITSKSIAKTFGLKYDFHKEAYKILEEYYTPEKFSKGRKKSFFKF